MFYPMPYYFPPFYPQLYKHAEEPKQPSWLATQVDWLANQASTALNWMKENPFKTLGIGVGAASTGYALYSLIKALRDKSRK